MPARLCGSLAGSGMRTALMTGPSMPRRGDGRLGARDAARGQAVFGARAALRADALAHRQRRWAGLGHRDLDRVGADHLLAALPFYSGGAAFLDGCPLIDAGIGDLVAPARLGRQPQHLPVAQPVGGEDHRLAPFLPDLAVHELAPRTQSAAEIPLEITWDATALFQAFSYRRCEIEDITNL